MKFKMEITALTPIHIGSGDKLIDPIDVIIEDIGDKKVIYYDFYKELAKKISMAEVNELINYLKNRREEKVKEKVRELVIKKYRIGKIYEMTSSKELKSAKEIDGHIKTNDGKLYIPGSSIKGVLKKTVMPHNMGRDILLVRDSSPTEKKSYYQASRIIIHPSRNARRTRSIPNPIIECIEKDTKLVVEGKIYELRAKKWIEAAFEKTQEQLREILKRLKNASVGREYAKELRENLEKLIEENDSILTIGRFNTKITKTINPMGRLKSFPAIYTNEGLTLPGIVKAKIKYE